MPITLGNLNFVAGTKNMGGLSGKVYSIPQEDILSIPPLDEDTNTITGPIVCKTGKCFTETYMTGDTGEVKDTEVGEKDGGSFEVNFEFWFPGISGELLAKKSQFANGAFVHICKDAQGVMRLIGNLDHGAYRVPGEVTTGKAPKDRRGASFKFQAASATPAPIYTGAIPLTPAV